MKAFSSLAVIIIALLLQGRVTAAAAGTAAVGTEVAMGPRNVGTQVGNETLELCVNTALSRDA